MRTSMLFCVAAVVLPLLLKGQNKSNVMKLNLEEAKLSCKLTTPELQQRKATVVAELKKLMLERVEVNNGYRYKFDGSDKMLDLLNSFIKTERLCCDFFTFTLTASDDKNFTLLDLTGPEGVKEFIKHEIDF